MISKKEFFTTYQPVLGPKLQQVKVKRHKTSFLWFGIFSFGNLSETELNWLLTCPQEDFLPNSLPTKDIQHFLPTYMDCRLDGASLRLEFFYFEFHCNLKQRKKFQSWPCLIISSACVLKICEIVVKEPLIKFFFGMGQVSWKIDRYKSNNSENSYCYEDEYHAGYFSLIIKHKIWFKNGLYGVISNS